MDQPVHAFCNACWGCGRIDATLTPAITNRHGEKSMRHEQTTIRVLGLIAVTAAVTLLFRMNQRVQERKLLRADAVRKLRESGEHFAISG